MQAALIALSEILGPGPAKRVALHDLNDRRPDVLKSMVQVARLPKKCRTAFDSRVQKLIGRDGSTGYAQIWPVELVECHDPLVRAVRHEWRELEYRGLAEQCMRDTVDAAKTAATQTGEYRVRTVLDALQNLGGALRNSAKQLQYDPKSADALDVLLEYAGLTERVKKICKDLDLTCEDKFARLHYKQYVLPHILADPNLDHMVRTYILKQHQPGLRTNAAQREGCADEEVQRGESSEITK